MKHQDNNKDQMKLVTKIVTIKHQNNNKDQIKLVNEASI